ncbi:MAG: NAD(P)-dependent oxidoreductase, partial [Pseudomonadota bacterium]
MSLLPNKAEAAKRRRSPARVEELAVLPVFYKLKGRRVVLAGSSDAAAWKGELLAAAGAEVHIYGENLDEAFETVMARQGARFVHHARPWAADCFEGAVIAIADAETEGEAQAFYCAALAAGVAVNVIDKPAFCQFQFGSIVNRSPTVVSISTDGAAPIFGQAIRRRIETLLPPVIQDWARLAQSLRATVNKHLPMGPLRRRFWERFVDTAFAGGPAERAEAALLDFIHDSEAESGVGRV